MGRQQSKREVGQRIYGYPTLEAPIPLKHNEASYFFRQVEEPSIEALNKATRGIRGSKVARILDYFTLTLAYPNQISRLREGSRLKDVPTMRQIAQKLGELQLASLEEPVVAEVLDVRPYAGAVGIYVEYPGYNAEQRAINGTVRDVLGFKPGRGITVGTKDLHVSIIRGDIRDVNLNQIKGSLPSQIHLSPAKLG
jgi:hypothetical protein